MKEQLKILMPEDATDDAMLVHHQLKKADFNFALLVANTKKEYLDGLCNFEPDLVLSDHSLPQFNSAEAFKIYRRLLHSQHRCAPFILVTGAVSEAFAAQCIKEGADDYILKDQFFNLRNAIRSALAKCEAKNKVQQEIVETKQLLKRYEYAARVAGVAVWDWDIVNNITIVTLALKLFLGTGVQNQLLLTSIRRL